MDRRTFTKAVAGIAAVGAASRVAPASAQQVAPEHIKTPAEGGPPFAIGMIIFPNMTNLDYAGPQQTFGWVRGAKIHTIAKTMDTVITDSGVRVVPDMTLAQAPELDMLLVGGGGGTTPLMEDPEVIGFLQARAPRAKWITSVCTGSLVLGAAGLLRGYKAASHWMTVDVLPTMGAIPSHDRVVIDRNRATGAGVTAGIDFGLVLIGHIWGQKLAERAQLGMEYAPAPPYNAGSPRTASPELVQTFQTMWAKQTQERFDAAARAAKKFT